MEIEKPLTVEQAAEVLGISRAHLYALVQRGQFPVVKLGRLTRVAPQALRDFINGGGTHRQLGTGTQEAR
jgi:excisionase family DNA binding protein